MRTLIACGLAAASFAFAGAPAAAQPIGGAAALAPTAPGGPAPCTSAGSHGLRYICNMRNPEDLKVLFGTKWMIASGMVAGSGIKLVDTQAKTGFMWNTSPHYRNMQDKAMYPACTAPMDHAKLNTHGLHLKPLGDGRYRMLATAHDGRETVEAYIVDPRPATPTLTWVGCIMAPAGVALNSVTSFSNGLVLATSPGQGKIYQWRPGQTTFVELPGGVANRVNGIDAAKDEKGFYAAALPDQQIVYFELTPTGAREVKRSPVMPYTPDNVSWDGDRLFAAGGFYDDPSCPRPPAAPPGQPTPTQSCYRGYVVSQLDPVTLESKIVAYADANPDYGGVAIAVVVGDDLWLSSARSDRLAWRKLPKPQ